MSKTTHWPSKWIFILAAVGSAAGLGNLWRFPYLAYEYGGGAFLLVIVLANILVGIPLLALEIGLGQKTQKGAPGAMSSIKKRCGSLGWFASTIALVVTTYYMVIIGWGIRYLYDSLTLAWGSDTEGYFLNSILNISEGPGVMGSISVPVLVGFLIAWVAVYFCIWKGVESVSKVVKYTATLPFIILLILIIRTLTLEGAGYGLSLFFIPDLTAIWSAELWIAAFSQVFFSLSVAMGIMFAYGSFKEPDSEIIESVIYVAIGNFLVSIMSGIVVFGTIGYLSHTTGTPFDEVFNKGVALTFMVFPHAISLLPAFNELFGVLFFLTVFTLGLDSGFSLLEAFTSGIKNSLPTVSTKKIALYISIIAALIGLLFTTSGGLFYLDIVDHFFIFYGVMLVGLLEVITVGWVMGTKPLREYINSVSEIKVGTFWDIMMKYVAPVILSILLISNVYNEFQQPYEGYPVWSLIWIGVVPLVAVGIISIILYYVFPPRNK